MILTTHALAGAAIGKNFDNSWLVIALALVFHYFLDTFRHGEYLNENSPWKEFWKAILDIAFSFSIIFSIIFFQNLPRATVFNIVLGVFFSMLPDGIFFLYWKFNFKFLAPLVKFHQRIHHPMEDEWNLRNSKNDILFSSMAIALLLLNFSF